MQPWAHHQVHKACQQTFQGMFLAPCHHNCNENNFKYIHDFKTNKKEGYDEFVIVMINFRTYPTVVIVTRAHQRPNGIELKSLSGFAYKEKMITLY